MSSSLANAVIRHKWTVNKNVYGDIIIHPGGAHESIMLKKFDGFSLEKYKVVLHRSAPNPMLPKITVSFDFGEEIDAQFNYKKLHECVQSQDKWPKEKAPYEDLFIEPERIIQAWKQGKMINRFSCSTEGVYFEAIPRNLAVAFPVKRITYDYGSYERNSYQYRQLEAIVMTRAARM